MPIIGLLITVVVLVLVLWVIQSFVASAKLKQLLYVIVALIVLVWLLDLFGALPSGRIGR